MPLIDTGLPRGRRAAWWPAIALALAATAACGSASSSTTSAAAPAAPAASSHAAASPSESMAETTATVGNDCGMIPASGMGSMHGMSMDPVVTAATHNPLITTLAAEIGKAGLTATLNSARDITIFAPDNAAFAMLTAHDMSMMSGMNELARILKYHVVSGNITPAELASGMTLTTLEGSQLKTAKMGAAYEVNNATVTCGNLHTANATVYIINAVLMPAH
ncbi:MAG TPA: fasciclin domain-containing protein [Streptosporangiaceae bacterium]